NIAAIKDGRHRPQAKYSRVVAGFSPDEYIGVVKHGQAVQHVHQVGRAELGRSTGRPDPLCQPCRLERVWSSESCHTLSPAGDALLSRLTSPTLIVSPSRSKYSMRGIVYLRLVPKRSRKLAGVISRLLDKYS